MTSLFEKLIEIRKSVPVVKRDGHNEWGGFRYSSSSAVLGAVRAKMDALGVLLVPDVVEHETSTVSVTDNDGSTKYRLIVHLFIKYTWINAEKPTERLECNAFTLGVDNDSKAVGKALTYGEKYFLKRFFNIPDDDSDPDKDKSQDYNGKPKANTNTRQWDGDASKLKGQCTQNQIRMIMAISAQLWSGLSNDDLKNQVQAVVDNMENPFEVNSRTMSKANASALITELKGLQAADKG